MTKLCGFLLYCLAVFVGLTGLLTGGLPLLEYAIKRLEGNGFDAYAVLDTYDRFYSEVILILSLMLLILVHIGHALAGGLRLAKPRQSVPTPQTDVMPRKQPRDMTSSSVEPGSMSADAASLDKKLAHLVKPPADNPDH